MKLQEIDFKKVAQAHQVILKAEAELKDITGQSQSLIITSEPPIQIIVSHDAVIKLIKQEVADYFKLKVSDLEGPSRKDILPDARGIAMLMIREAFSPKLSYKSIGLCFGGRDHSSVITRISTLNKNAFWEPELKQRIDEMLAKIDMLKHYNQQ